MKRFMKTPVDNITEFFTLFSERNLLGLSASIGFYLVLSLTPFLLLMFALTAVIGWESSSDFRSAVAEGLGPSAAIGLDAISQRLDADRGSGVSFGIIGLITILFSSSGFIGEIRDALNRVILPMNAQVNPAAASAAAENERVQLETMTTWQAIRQWAVERLFAIIAVICCICIAILSFAGSVALRWLIPADENFWRNVNTLGAFVVFAFLFYAMFRFLPSRQPRDGFAFSAAIICSALFHIGNKALEVYFANSAFSNSYGALAGFIILLVWAQYNGLIVLISAVSAQVFFTQKKPVEAISKGAVQRSRAELQSQPARRPHVTDSQISGSPIEH